MVDKWAAARWHLTRVLETLLPRHCMSCGGPTDSPGWCEHCTDALPWNDTACPRCALPTPLGAVCAHCLQRPPPFDGALAVFRLQAPVQQSIHRLKYHGDFTQAQCLADLTAKRIRAKGIDRPQALIPVPLHSRRLQWRGYNQAQELARRLGRELGIAVLTHAAQRRRATGDQIGQDASARRRNMRGAFAVTADLRDRHVALVDDVMTTGATLAELARCCRRRGAARVDVWVIARTP